MDLLLLVLVGIIALGIGVGVAIVLSRRALASQATVSEDTARQRLAEAEAMQQQWLEEARREADGLRSATEADVQAQRAELKAEQ